MHTFYFSKKDTWISSGSNLITGVSQRDQNFGQDEILELKKFYHNNSLNHITRVLVDFDINPLSQSIARGEIPLLGSTDSTSRAFLRLYEAEGNRDNSSEYKIVAHMLSASWDEGTGKFGDSPKVTDGCSWDNRQNKPGSTAVSWSNNSAGKYNDGQDYITGSNTFGVQSFSYESPDINMDMTVPILLQIFNNNKNYPIEGYLLRFSGSQELATGTDGEITYGDLKFFSKNTNTIYAPKLEVKWNDSTFDSNVTGSMNELTMSGLADNFLYMRGLKESYKEGEKVKFRVGARKRYIQKTFIHQFKLQQVHMYQLVVVGIQ
tara:strand:+ start:6820 stop:7779 length:960 start_codon:yes stop_codon:yes gene_type:complete